MVGLESIGVVCVSGNGGKLTQRWSIMVPVRDAVNGFIKATVMIVAMNDNCCTRRSDVRRRSYRMSDNSGKLSSDNSGDCLHK